MKPLLLAVIFVLSQLQSCEAQLQSAPNYDLLQSAPPKAPIQKPADKSSITETPTPRKPPPKQAAKPTAPIQLPKPHVGGKQVEWPPICMIVLGFKSCPPCVAMADDIQQIREEGHRVFYADIDQQPWLPKMFKVKYGYPHTAMVINGVVVEQHDGELNACAMRNWFEEAKRAMAGEIEFDPSIRYTKGAPQQRRTSGGG